MPRLDRFAFAVLILVAGLLLFWRLGARYLWQDEAATAVLGERMLRHGKPLAWDGRNLITIDLFDPGEWATLDARTGSADAALRHQRARRDFKPDGTWIFHPWGQFLLAGTSLALFGHDAFAARLPFALAALLTVALLWLHVRRVFGDRTLATLACALLIANAYWILHARQCRYYALSSLALVLSLSAFDRWQRGSRWGASLFVAAGFFYFHVDFGSFFPAMAVLAGFALFRVGRRRQAALLFAALGALIAPFAWYYDLLARARAASTTLRDLVLGNVFNLNQFVLPFLVAAAAFWLVARKRAELPARQRDAVLIPVAIALALLIWVPAVAPSWFLRYLVQLAPAAALVTSWVILQVAAGASSRPAVRGALTAALALLVSGTALVSYPVTALAQALQGAPMTETFSDLALRAELELAAREIFLPHPDPNRIVVEWLQPRLRPGDEILANYEDVPLMFYTGARVRGGLAAFRVEDRSAPPARFMVIRRSVPFVYWPVFRREAARWQWRYASTGAPDVPFGNNPDPTALGIAAHDEVLVGELIGEAAREPGGHAAAGTR